MHSPRTLALLLCLGPFVGATLTAQEGGKPKVDFAAQILPILQKRCVECHGAEDPDGELRLDTKQGLFPKEKKWWTVIPGKPGKSLLYERITLPKDDDEIMPAEGEPLSKAQIALFKQWILEGAHWPDEVKGKAPAGAPKETPLALPQLDAAGKQAQARAMAAIQKLGGLAMSVAQNSSATEVNLSLLGKRAGDAALGELAPMAKSLVRLNLARTAVGDAGMRAVAQLGQLRWLNLAGTEVGDAGLAALVGLQHLSYLNLYGSKVSDASVERLAAMPGLKKVFVWQSQVSAKGAARLREARPGLLVDRGEAAVALSKVVVGPKPINQSCPVSGKPIAVNKKVIHEGQAIGLCCGKCIAAFKKQPAKYLGKVAAFVPTRAKAPQNKHCPLNSKKAVNPKQSLAYQGVRVGFCCGKCKGRFAQNPGAFDKSLQPLIKAAREAQAQQGGARPGQQKGQQKN